MDPLAPNPRIALPGIPQVGDIIAEKYRVEGVLGVGGMGVVVAARHLQLGQAVAIKILSVAEDKQSDAVERFLREGRAAAALVSDHVVKIYDVGQTDTGVPFMVMECLRGRDLAAVLTERGPLPIDEAVEYVAQATMAIAEAHEAGIIHRDLKPSNLFLTRRSDGSACVKVLDFGISKQLSMFDSQTMRPDLTSTRQVMGSPAYMSPEQIRDARSVDHRTDVWALGTTLYELLTHHVAFNADTLPAVCAAIAADPPTPIESHRGDVPQALAEIVMRCLEKSPAQRFQSARSLLGALRVLQGRADVLVSARDPLAPSGSRGSVQAVAAAQIKESNPEIKESGERSVAKSNAVDPSESTLLSGRGASSPLPPPPEGGSVEPKAHKPLVLSLRTRTQLRYAVMGMVGLFGVVAVGFALQRGSVSVAPSPDSGSFTLRIESEPAGATVFEGERWLGETPLVLPVSRQSVEVHARQFLVRKSGYGDARVEQGRSASDRQVQVTLSKREPEAGSMEPSLRTSPQTSQHADLESSPAGSKKAAVSKPGAKVGVSRAAKGAEPQGESPKGASTSDIRIVR